GLTPCAEQSPETTFGADHSSFPTGPHHLLGSDIYLIRIGGSGFPFGSHFTHIPPDSRIVISENRIGQNRERLFRRLASGRFTPQCRERGSRRKAHDFVFDEQRLRFGSGIPPLLSPGRRNRQSGEGDVLQCAIGHYRQPLLAELGGGGA